MCIVSAVTDYDGFKPWKPWNKPPWLVPYPKTYPNYPIDDFDISEIVAEDDIEKENINMSTVILDYDTKVSIDYWTIEMCEKYIELLEKALEFDELFNEPNCSDPNKTKILNLVSARVLELSTVTKDKKINKGHMDLILRIKSVLESL